MSGEKSDVFRQVVDRAKSEHGATISIVAPNMHAEAFQKPGLPTVYTAIEETKERLAALLHTHSTHRRLYARELQVRGEVEAGVEAVLQELLDLGATVTVTPNRYRIDVVNPADEWDGTIPEGTTEIFLDQSVGRPTGRHTEGDEGQFKRDYGISPFIVEEPGEGTSFDKPADGIWPPQFVAKLREYHDNGWVIHLNHRTPIRRPWKGQSPIARAAL